jgi:hypothetical protein
MSSSGSSRNFKSLLLLGALIVATGILMFTMTPSAMAQSNTGTLTGQIVDQQGAVIAGAAIRIVDPATSSARDTVSNDVGRYTVTGVPPGTYDITVTKEGFTAAKLTGQKVDIGQVLTLNVPLTIGATTTTVEVKATAGAELQTLNATVGATMNQEALQMLPNLGRDASTLSVFQVGVSLDGNVAGSAIDQNKFQLDGGNNSDDMAGGNTTYTPGTGFAGAAATGGTPTGVMPTPIESIEEFKVGTLGQGADFGGAGGSQIQMATKRGTNTYHGAVYEYYFANNVGAANLWRNNHTIVNGAAIPLPATHRNRYGGAFGGALPIPKFAGGKTYFFANYEAMAYPNAVSFERATPSATFRAGVIMLPNTAGGVSGYNINNAPVTVNGVTYAGCGATQSCDPRGLGVNPLVQKIWNTMPLPNDSTYLGGLGDGYGNSGGYLANLSTPQNSKFIVGRIDHDFNDKWKFMVSYRGYDFSQLVNTQTDMGGLLPGATAGQYTSFAPRPLKPIYWVTGLTTTLSPNMTNDFRFSYLKNFWQWSTQAGPPQVAGLGGAFEIGGESANALIPYNVDSQDVRQRFWDGHDYFLSDNISKLHGNHLFQFGGSYQRNNDLHGRNDNGVGIDTSPAYLAYSGSGISNNAYTLPPAVQSGALTNYAALFDMVTGTLTSTQVMYTRSGSGLTLNPLGTPGSDHSVIPSYDTYFTDTWHVRPSLTLTYGLSWGLAMPPYELDGKQVLMVDQAGNPIDIKGYLTNRKTAALQGQVYEPTIGFALLGNSSGGQNKYPYKPFYGGFSPHVSLAWSPNAHDGIMGKILGQNKTVVRGGYGRIYGRLNGVDLMLVPLLGPGLLQAVSCFGPTIQGTCGGVGGATLLNAFRPGVDGLVAPLPGVGAAANQITANLPQPFFPGTIQAGSANPSAAAADGSQLDPNMRPNHSDEVTMTIQRSFSPKVMLEVGYIGRTIKNEFQEINLDAVPTMTTLNGQSFAQAYANVYTQYCGLGAVCAQTASAVTSQPFFEAAMGGPNSPYCAGKASCTAAVVANEGANFKTTAVYNMWLDLNKANGWTLGRTMLAAPALGGAVNPQLSGAFDFINSYGHGNYNAAFLSFKTMNWHGLTTQSSFTYGKALGTGSVTQASSSITVPNPYDFDRFGSYGTQPFDVKYTYSLLMFYQEPWFRTQKGILGHVVGGWTVAPLFTARSGLPLRVTGQSTAQSFGEIYSGQSANYEEAAGVSPFTGGNSAQYNVVSAGAGSNGNAAKGGTGINMFADPAAVAAEFRAGVLGIDGNSGGAGVIRGFNFWNLDATLSKDFRATERIGATLNIQFVNVLNHFVPANPTVNTASLGSFGNVTNQFTTGNGAQARWMEFGLRLRF